MRPAAVLAGVLTVAAAGMAVAAFAGGGDPAPAPPATATEAAEAAAAPPGLAVWTAQGCGGCHTLAAADSHGTVGPDLEQTLRRMPAGYVKESIVAPDAAISAGYGSGTMPGDYAQRISPADLDRLVTFLMDSSAG